jgi:phenylacetate-coenzyme A ligase PaaK-like adenylate-forming protein
MRLERAVFGGILLPAAYWATGDQRLRNIPGLIANERLEPGRLRQLQLAKLQRLLTHAQRHVPHFRDLFRTVGFDPARLESVAQLRALPPMTRESVKQNLDSFRSEAIPATEVVRDATGGSTGTPMEFFHEERYRQLAVGSAYRTRMWTGWKPGSRMAWIWGAPQETRAWVTLRGRAVGWLNRNIYFDAFRAGPVEMEEWRRRFEDYRPEYVYGYASSITHFARHLADRGVVLSGIQGVMSTAEKLHAWQRELISATFQSPVYDHYGSREVKAIAAQCESGGMHVLCDLNIVDVEDDSAPASPLLVTCLENFAMPFVRYKIGDVGALRSGACPCGRTFPLLDLSIGRESDIFMTPEGREFHGEYFTHLMYGVAGIARFQFFQPSAERVVLRVVPGTDFGPETKLILDSFRGKVRNEISAGMAFEISLVEDIPVSPTGKHRFTWSEARSGRPTA